MLSLAAGAYTASYAGLVLMALSYVAQRSLGRLHAKVSNFMPLEVHRARAIAISRGGKGGGAPPARAPDRLPPNAAA